MKWSSSSVLWDFCDHWITMLRNHMVIIIINFNIGTYYWFDHARSLIPATNIECFRYSNQKPPTEICNVEAHSPLPSIFWCLWFCKEKIILHLWELYLGKFTYDITWINGGYCPSLSKLMALYHVHGWRCKFFYVICWSVRCVVKTWPCMVNICMYGGVGPN